MEFYSYLSSRGRLGVLGGIEAPLKDVYILPVSKNQPIPKVLLPFRAGPGLPENRDHCLLAVVTRHYPDASLSTMRSKRKSSLGHLDIGNKKRVKISSTVSPMEEDKNDDDDEPYTPWEEEDEDSLPVVTPSGDDNLKKHLQELQERIQKEQQDIESITVALHGSKNIKGIPGLDGDFAEEGSSSAQIGPAITKKLASDMNVLNPITVTTSVAMEETQIISESDLVIDNPDKVTIDLDFEATKKEEVKVLSTSSDDKKDSTTFSASKVFEKFSFFSKKRDEHVAKKSTACVIPGLELAAEKDESALEMTTKKTEDPDILVEEMPFFNPVPKISNKVFPGLSFLSEAAEAVKNRQDNFSIHKEVDISPKKATDESKVQEIVEIPDDVEEEPLPPGLEKEPLPPGLEDDPEPCIPGLDKTPVPPSVVKAKLLPTPAPTVEKEPLPPGLDDEPLPPGEEEPRPPVVGVDRPIKFGKITFSLPTPIKPLEDTDDRVLPPTVPSGIDPRLPIEGSPCKPEVISAPGSGIPSPIRAVPPTSQNVMKMINLNVPPPLIGIPGSHPPPPGPPMSLLPLGGIRFPTNIPPPSLLPMNNPGVGVRNPLVGGVPMQIVGGVRAPFIPPVPTGPPSRFSKHSQEPVVSPSRNMHDEGDDEEPPARDYGGRGNRGGHHTGDGYMARGRGRGRGGRWDHSRRSPPEQARRERHYGGTPGRRRFPDQRAGGEGRSDYDRHRRRRSRSRSPVGRNRSRSRSRSRY